MSKCLIGSAAVLFFVTLVFSPTIASSFDEDLQYQSRAKAGFYLRIPFSGGLKHSDDIDLQYGLRMGFSSSYNVGHSFTSNYKQYNSSIIDLRFNGCGFNSLNFAGQKLVNSKGIWLGASESGVKSSMPIIIGGIFVIAVSAVALGGGEDAYEEPIRCAIGDIECLCREGLVQDCGWQG